MLCSGLLNRTKHATVKLKINTVGDGITINHFCTTSFKKRVENMSQMDEDVIYFQQRINALNIKRTLQFNIKTKTNQ